VAVQVLAGSVVPHRGSRVGVPGGDLHVAQVNTGIEHGRDESVAEHVRVCPGDLDAGGLGEVAQAAGGGVRSILLEQAKLGPERRGLLRLQALALIGQGNPDAVIRFSGD